MGSYQHKQGGVSPQNFQFVEYLPRGERINQVYNIRWSVLLTSSLLKVLLNMELRKLTSVCKLTTF